MADPEISIRVNPDNFLVIIGPYKLPPEKLLDAFGAIASRGPYVVSRLVCGLLQYFYRLKATCDVPGGFRPLPPPSPPLDKLMSRDFCCNHFVKRSHL